MDSNINLDKLVIMVQKEVADRFLAKPHSKEYGYITVVLNYYFDISKVTNVSKYAFKPVPKVESTVLRLVPKNNKEDLDFNKYKFFLKKCFSQKRKTLKNNLKGYNWNLVNEILNKYNLSENVRAEEISGEILVEIFKNLSNGES